MLLMGIGGGLAVSPLSVVIMATVPPEDAGAAGGALQTMQQLGATLGLAILVRVAGSTSRGVTGSADEVLAGHEQRVHRRLGDRTADVRGGTHFQAALVVDRRDQAVAVGDAPSRTTA